MKTILARYGLTVFLGMLMTITASAVSFGSVYEKNKNVFYKDSSGKTTQLTTSGRDEGAVIHPKGEWIYFIRSFEGSFKGENYCPPKGKKVKPGILKDELWRIKKDGTGAKMLYRAQDVGVDGADENYSVASAGNIQFSPDGDKVYFETSKWATSNGLRVMNADGSKEKLLGSGNGTKIILSSNEKRYRGYIVTSQHRYFIGGGTYDWFYLFTPDMKKEIGPLGDDIASFTETYQVKYTDGSEKQILAKSKSDNK